MLFAIPLGLWAVVVTITLLRHPHFVAESSILAEVRESDIPGPLSGLAAQFGLTMGEAGAGTIDFYATVLKARGLLRRAVLSEYAIPVQSSGHDTLSGTLVELYAIQASTEDARVRGAVGQLQKAITVDTDPRSRVITVATSAPSPELAIAINHRLLALLAEFNLEQRQTRARVERQFVEERLGEARRALEQAEQEQARFLEANRRYEESPRLVAEAARLQRRVDLRQRVFMTLSEAYEQARIEEVRNTPGVTVVDPAEHSVRRVGRGLLAKSLAALLVGGVVAAGIVFFREFVRDQRARDPLAFAELDSLLRNMLSLTPKQK
jgi:uncharacterized protein involved in exopolysaccharide biosynthesis